MVIIDVKQLYGEMTKIDSLQDYVTKAKEMASTGQDVVLTGQALCGYILP